MREKERRKTLKTFINTAVIGNYYRYNVYKITDSAEQTYYIAEPINHGATRTANTEEELQAILHTDLIKLNNFWTKVR